MSADIRDIIAGALDHDALGAPAAATPYDLADRIIAALTEALPNFDAAAVMHLALGKIAVGRPNNGLPVSSRAAQQIARVALVEAGLEWPRKFYPVKPA